MMSIRLVVIDGHTLVRYGLRCLAERQPDMEVLGEAAGAAGAAALVARLSPDVVTVDVALPDADGLALARELRGRSAGLGVVVLTAAHADEVLFRALDAGVSAFVLKSAPAVEVLSAIRHAAVAAASFTAAGLADALARRRDGTDRTALSPREREVLSLLQDGLSVPAIARTMYVSQSTAKTYVGRLYEKLGASSRAQALMTALQLGIIQYQPAPEARADVRANGRSDGRPDPRPDARADARADGRPDGPTAARAEARTDGRADARTDGRSAGPTDGRADGPAEEARAGDGAAAVGSGRGLAGRR